MVVGLFVDISGYIERFNYSQEEHMEDWLFELGCNSTETIREYELIELEDNTNILIIGIEREGNMRVNNFDLRLSSAIPYGFLLIVRFDINETFLDLDRDLFMLEYGIEENLFDTIIEDELRQQEEDSGYDYSDSFISENDDFLDYLDYLRDHPRDSD